MPAYERIRVVLHGLAAAPQQILVDGQPITRLTGPGTAYQAGRFDAQAHLCPPEEGTTSSRPPFVLETGMFHTIEVQI